jgi:hypothetical protein
MLEFEVQRCTRRCAKSDRELQPGEAFFSVLVPQGASVVRLDFAVDAWEGPPEGALGWWQSRLPEANAHKMHWAPNDVMLHYFEELEGRPDQADARYVLALLMVRRRILRLEATETDDGGGETLVLFCSRNDTEYRLAATMPSAERAAEIQNELAKLLYSEAGA